MKTYCLALDLKDDPALIAEYKRYHEPSQIWPEVVEHIKSKEILSEEIFLLGTRIVMVLRTTDHFNFEAKDVTDRANCKMQEWENLMWKYQQPVPQAEPGQKWVLMEKIFEVITIFTDLVSRSLIMKNMKDIMKFFLSRQLACTCSGELFSCFSHKIHGLATCRIDSRQ